MSEVYASDRFREGDLSTLACGDALEATQDSIHHSVLVLLVDSFRGRRYVR